MRKTLLLLLLLITAQIQAQVATGQEQYFDYGIQVNPAALPIPSTINYLGTFGNDGVQGRVLPTALPVSDAVHGITSNMARATMATGFIDTADSFDLYKFDDNTLGVEASQFGIVFSQYFKVPPFAVESGIKNLTARTVSLAATGIPIGTTAIKYVGWRAADDAIVFADAPYIQSVEICQLGIVFVKNVGGVISFLDAARTVATIPDISGYSNLETVGIGIKATPLVLPNTNLTVKNTAGDIRGISVNWHGTNNDLRVVPANSVLIFSRLHPGNKLTTTPPVTTTAVDATTYWNGSALIAVPANNNATVQRWLMTITGTFILQAGEAFYANFDTAYKSASTATFSDILPLGTFVEVSRMISVKTVTDLSDTTTCVFVSTSGGGGGLTAATATLQTAYNASLVPQITTSASLGAVTIKEGAGADTVPILEGKNLAGATTSSIDGSGNIIGATVKAVNLSDNRIPRSSPTGLINSTITDNGTSVIMGDSTNPVYGTFTLFKDRATAFSITDAGLFNLNAPDLNLFNVSVTTGSYSSLKLTSHGGTAAKMFGFHNITEGPGAGRLIITGGQVGAGQTEIMTLTNTNKVLIGKTSDSADGLLQVNGQVSGQAATSVNQFVTKAQLDLKANLASPALTGTPTAPTAMTSTATTQIATTAFVITQSGFGNFQPTNTGSFIFQPSFMAFNDKLVTVTLRFNYTTNSSSSMIFTLPFGIIMNASFFSAGYPLGSSTGALGGSINTPAGFAVAKAFSSDQIEISVSGGTSSSLYSLTFQIIEN